LGGTVLMMVAKAETGDMAMVVSAPAAASLDGFVGWDDCGANEALDAGKWLPCGQSPAASASRGY
jgi:hypothetical protein